MRRSTLNKSGLTVGILLVLATAATAGDDILIADFEQKTYGDWKVEGEAFGKGPARGTIGGQQHVSGFEGKGLVNSFLGGDLPTGTLTSPPFTIDRDYITFLMGGGGHKGQTCMNLLIDPSSSGDFDATRAKVVLAATGPNTQPGGSEFLSWENWDVKKYKGKKAVIQIVDKHSGVWGHINVDQISQSNTQAKKKAVPAEAAVVRTDGPPQPVGVDVELEAQAATAYYVAPGGRDSYPGTKEKPFATLESARDAVRASRQAGAEGAAATVWLRGGNYFLSETFRLDDRDSGVAFRAAPGEEPVVYGGTRITGWKKWKENIYRAKVPAGKRFFQLIHGRRAAVMAQHPNRGSGYGQNGLSGGYARGWRTVNNTHVGVHGKDRESDYSDAQVFGFIGLNWFSEMREVLSFTGTGLMIDGGSGNFKGLNGRVYVRGVLELLDEPGEWCLKHKEGYVYYWPRDRRQEPGDRGQEKTKYALGDEDIIVAPCAERTVEVKGRSPETPAEDIRFEGITFVGSDFCARWWLFSFARKDHGSTPEPLQQGLLFGENVRRLTVRGCRILAAGHSGVWLNNWAQECTVENCWIEGAGTAGVYMNSYIPGKAPYKTAAEAYINKKHRIVNNFIYDCGLSGCKGSGIQFYQSGENEILHNRIARMPRYGLSHPGIRYGELPATLYGVKKTFENHFEVLHSRNNRIAFNDISNVCRDASDFGGIQAWGAGRDNVWENNAVHDIDQSVTWDAWAHGLFPDDGSHYHTIRNNIVYEIKGGRATAGVMCKSGGQVVENNIFADNVLAWVFTDMPYIEPAFDQVIRRNIVFGPVPKIYGTGNPARPQNFKEVDRNIFWPRPQQLDALQKGGWEKNAVVADPRFLRKNKPWDTTYEDFRLPPDSPAVKAGFQPIDVDRIGLRDDFPFDRKEMFRKPAWKEIEAEDYDRMHDLKTAGGYGINHMQPGAWAKYENVDFGDGTLTHIRASLTGKPAVELRLGSPKGRIIGSIAAGKSVAKVEPVKGRQTLFLVFQGSDLQHALLNDLLDSFVFMPGDMPAEAK